MIIIAGIKTEKKEVLVIYDKGARKLKFKEENRKKSFGIKENVKP